MDDRILLKETIEKGGTARSFDKGIGSYTNTDALEYLAEMQSEMDTHSSSPVAVWQRKPSKERSDLMRFILGSEDQPGPLMKLFSAVNRDHEPIIQAGSRRTQRSLRTGVNQPAKRQIRVARLLLKGYLYEKPMRLEGWRYVLRLVSQTDSTGSWSQRTH